MRLWTIHPRYLDAKGLLAAWREGLLAQKVLKGETRGYRNHPQLKRFRACDDAMGAIAGYLRGIFREAERRGYRFTEDKIEASAVGARLLSTRGQLLYEWNHLKQKLRLRDTEKYRDIEDIAEPEPHPIFRIVDGEVEDWEITKGRASVKGAQS